MRFRLRLLLLWLCISASIFVSKPAVAQTTCGLRMRRSWSSLSDGDQMLYKNALAAAMDSGAYAKFVEMHTEMMSTTEAHKSCMFIYWHRLFLVVFENMLRGQGSAYACITVPYWDWISDYNRFTTHQCKTLLSCSSALQGLGGVSGSSMFLRINGVQTMGNCSAAFPLNHFCHATDAKGSQCVRCVTRGPWDSNRLPGTASYASVRNQLFAATNIDQMSTAIENGVHNNIHAVLNGSMATFASPADPIFWSHHAMVDLLHTIFHKCRVGEQLMTMAQKVASPIGWSSCKRQNGTAFSPYDSVVMHTGAYGRDPIGGANDSLVGKYFDGVPHQFAALMDHNDLGSSSYVYLYQGLLGEMYYKCGNSTADPAKVPTPTQVPIPVPPPSPTTRARVPSAPAPAPAPIPFRTPAPTGAPISTFAPNTKPPAPPTKSPTPRPTSSSSEVPITAARTLNPVPASSTDLQGSPQLQDQDETPEPISSTLARIIAELSAEAPATTELSTRTQAPTSPPAAPTDVLAALALASFTSFSVISPIFPAAPVVPVAPLDEPTTDSPAPVIIAAINNTLDASAQKVSTFTSDTDAFLETRLGQSVDQVDEQEKMACMFQAECLGGVQDYSESFKRTFHSCGKPRCKKIVDDIRSGNDTIGLSDWKQKMMETFGCPIPTTIVQPSLA